MKEFAISFLTLDRPTCLERGLKSINDGGWDFTSRIVVDDGSTPEHLEKNIKICEEEDFDILIKNERYGIANSWNMAIIYSEGRYVILSVDDLVYKPDGTWLEVIYAGFHYGFPCVEIPSVETGDNTVVRALDKMTIPKVGWYNERFPAAGCDDNDFIIRLRIAFNTNKVIPLYNRKGLVRHIPGETAYWKHDDERSKNAEFFLEKWNIRREVLANGNLDRETMSDRKLEDIDFYPDITDRYITGDFSAEKTMRSHIAKRIRRRVKV